MQEIRKGILAVLLVAMLFIPVEAYAKSDNVVIADDANLLTDQEETELQSYLETLNSDLNYVAVTNDSAVYSSNVDGKLESYYSSHYSNNSDGIAFIIDMYNREVYISGYGEISGRIKNDDATDITDNIYGYASKGDYYSCIYNAFVQADTLVNKGMILRPMRIIVSLLIAIILGFLGTFIAAMLERSHVEYSDGAAQILMTGATIAGTAVIYDTRRVRRSSDTGVHSSGGYSGGGGGFSGGGGGGGHSGGGHSF